MRKHSTKLFHTLLLVMAVTYLGGCTTFPFYDDFSDPSTLSDYHIIDDRVTDNYQIVSGQLQVTASVNQDLWGGPAVGGGPPAKRGAPLLLIDAPAGLYTAEALVTATNTISPGGPQALNTQVGLFVFRDMTNWMFYGFTNHNFTIDGETTVGNGLIATVTVGGSSSIHHEWVAAPAEDTLYLRLKKYGSSSDIRYELKYKVDRADPWTDFAPTISFPNPLAMSEEVGMGVKTFDLSGAGVSNPGLGIFDDFLVDRY